LDRFLGIATDSICTMALLRRKTIRKLQGVLERVDDGWLFGWM
jgi:hypothetical protein